MHQNNPLPTISFIIPAYNEEDLLGQTLSAVNAAGRALGEPFEVIVADDASTDRTAAIAAEHGARVVSVHNRQIAATRNSGAKEATGAFLCFVDADTVVTETVVRAAVDALQAGAAGGGCGIQFDGHVPLFGRFLEFVFMPVYRTLGLAAGCFLFCTRQAFDAVGGFDERFFGAEEAVMSRRLHQQGRFVVLRERVMTSGRKLRAYSTREILSILLHIAWRPSAVRQRDGLEIWYGERRTDPQSLP